MKQADIDKITGEILALNNDPVKKYEFICACANAKAIAENKIQAEAVKKSIEISLGNMLMNIKSK